MANASSQAQRIRQFAYGMPRPGRQRQAHLLATQAQSNQSPFHQMESASYLALLTIPSVSGMPRRGRQWQALSLDITLCQVLWYSSKTAGASSRALTMGQFACGMEQY